MQHREIKVRRKSLWRSGNVKRARKFANMRAAKERLRMERLANPTECPQPAKAPRTKAKPSGFVITIRCLDDGERVTLRTARGPWGLTVSATNCARKVAAVLQHYRAAS